MSTEIGSVRGARGEEILVSSFCAGQDFGVAFQLTAPYGGQEGYVCLSLDGIRHLARIVEAQAPDCRGYVVVESKKSECSSRMTDFDKAMKTFGLIPPKKTAGLYALVKVHPTEEE